MVKKYARVRNVPVFIMQKASKGLRKGQVAVQSLIDGSTAVVQKGVVKGVTTKFPRLKKRK